MSTIARGQEGGKVSWTEDTRQNIKKQEEVEHPALNSDCFLMKSTCIVK